MMNKLIKLKDKFILVSDEPIKEGDYITTCGDIDDGTLFISKYTKGHLGVGSKIIAGIPELPSIDFSLLSEEDCKRIGWVDVEKLAQDLILKKYPFPNYSDIGYWKDLFTEGFKTAQSLNDKIFSLEDMVNFSKWIADTKKHGSVKQMYEAMIVNKVNTVEELISIWQSLQQTSWDVEVEMEEYFHSPSPIGMSVDERPKITNNSIKVTKAL